MRLAFACLLAAIVAAPSSGSASPITNSSALGWGDGEARQFALELFDDGAYRFTVDGFASATYQAAWDCCAGFFDPIRDVRPSATLTFTDLRVNTMPVNTTFSDNLDLEFLRRAEIMSILSLTGRVTLNWNEPDVPLLLFSLFEPPTPESDILPLRTAVPEPALIVLFGAGLAAAALRVRSRLRK
jgi:hypothetical protein